MDKINTGAMSDQARELMEKKARLEEQCRECDQLIKDLNQVCQDKVYTAFAARYEQYKPTMESLCQCLEAYSRFISGVGEDYDGFIASVLSKL